MSAELERLQKARDKAHDKLQTAEYEFMLKDRALEAFKRREAAKARAAEMVDGGRGAA